MAAIQDPKHEEHESVLEWIGGEFDPDAFDMKFINKKTQDSEIVIFLPVSAFTQDLLHYPGSICGWAQTNFYMPV